MRRSLLILSILVLLIGCKKDPPIPFCELHPDECVDVRQVKEYFYFKHGSYWVYEEEHSGKRDSVYVLETYSDTSNYYFTTKLHSTYDGYDYRFWTSGSTSDGDDNIVDKSKRSTIVKRSKTGGEEGFVAEATCFLFYPTVGLSGYTYGGAHISNNVLKVSNVMDFFMVSGNEFECVVQMSEEHTAIEESQPTEHYYSRGIGIVKKELIDSNQVWTLA